MYLQKAMDARKANGVRRYHTEQIISVDTVGQHSANAAMLAILFVENPSVALIKHLLTHDYAEGRYGDIPAPVKWDNPQLALEYALMEKNYAKNQGLSFENDLTDRELELARICDITDAALFGYSEFLLGNVFGTVIFWRCYQVLHKGELPAEFVTLLEEIAQQIYLLERHSGK